MCKAFMFGSLVLVGSHWIDQTWSSPPLWFRTFGSALALASVAHDRLAVIRSNGAWKLKGSKGRKIQNTKIYKRGRQDMARHGKTWPDWWKAKRHTFGLYGDLVAGALGRQSARGLQKKRFAIFYHIYVHQVRHTAIMNRACLGQRRKAFDHDLMQSAICEFLHKSIYNLSWIWWKQSLQKTTTNILIISSVPRSR